MTPEQWLKKPNQERTLLAKVEYLNNGLKTEYLSTHPFQSLPTDTLANIPFNDFVIEPPNFSRRMGVFTGSSTATRSKLSLYAHDVLEKLSEGNVFNQKVQYLIGDDAWPLDNFIPIAEQLAESSVTTTDEITINMRDPSLKLDNQVDTGTFLSGPNAGKIKPLCIGDVLNIEPVLENTATHTYCVNYIGVQDVSNVKDNGVSVSFSKDNANGLFTLNQAPTGRITCDVLGSKPNTFLQYPGEVLAWLLTTFANENNIADLSALPNYKIGLYRKEPKTLRPLIDFICRSILGYHFYTRLGQFNAAVMPIITNTPSALLTLDDVLESGVRKRKSFEPASKVIVNYRQNYTVQSDGLAGSVSAENRDLYGKEYQTIEVNNSLPDYPNAQPISVNTCLVNEADAQSLGNTKALFSSVKRTVYEINALGIPFTFELGQEVELTFYGFGFDNGRTGIITGLNDKPIDGEVTVELWR